MKQLAAVALLLVAFPVVAQRPATPTVQATGQGQVGASVGGRVAPSGTELHVDLDPELYQRNISSRGLGCCVFRSIDHVGRYMNLPAVIGMPEWMVKKGIAGGGYPEKCDKLIPQIARERGLPVPEYIHVTGRDIKILELACKSGRMACITYGVSPTGRYNGKRIAHMTNLVHCDLAADSGKGLIAQLDNNYVTPRGECYEWMTTQEFERAYHSGGGGWAMIFLAPPPPRLPWN